MNLDSKLQTTVLPYTYQSFKETVFRTKLLSFSTLEEFFLSFVLSNLKKPQVGRVFVVFSCFPFGSLGRLLDLPPFALPPVELPVEVPLAAAGVRHVLLVVEEVAVLQGVAHALLILRVGVK